MTKGKNYRRNKSRTRNDKPLKFIKGCLLKPRDYDEVELDKESYNKLLSYMRKEANLLKEDGKLPEVKFITLALKTRRYIKENLPGYAERLREWSEICSLLNQVASSG